MTVKIDVTAYPERRGITFDRAERGGAIVPGTAVTIAPPDESSAARVQPATALSPIAGIAAGVTGGKVQVATSGVVQLTPEQWNAVAGGALVAGAAYWAGEDGLLTRRPMGTQVGVAISPTQLRVEIRSPRPKLELPTWPSALPDAALIDIGELAGLRMIRGIWNGSYIVDTVHDEQGVRDVVTIELDDRVVIFKDSGADACTIYKVSRDEFATIVRAAEDEPPLFAPLDPAIVANLVLHERLRLRVLRAFDERTGVCVLEIGTALVAGSLGIFEPVSDLGERRSLVPEFVYRWDPSGLDVEP